MAIVTLTTDFGTVDGYVGAMKGVLLALAPGTTVADVTHEVPPQDVAAGAFALAQAAGLFPPGTIHVAVVDPGVGGERAGLVVEAGGALFVGPDNGLLSLAAHGPRRVRRIENEAWLRVPVCPTFHGRDVFAPVAARLARGEAMREVGPTVDAIASLRGGAEESGRGDDLGGEGTILHVDRFGNLVTSFAPGQLAAGAFLLAAASGVRHAVRAGRTFSDVGRGEAVVYDGSAGRVEIAVRDGSAAATLGLGRGERVRLTRITSS
jgi:S-adenosyl-L-methionine hydrolase (adenosine-forming)